MNWENMRSQSIRSFLRSALTLALLFGSEPLLRAGESTELKQIRAQFEGYAQELEFLSLSVVLNDAEKPRFQAMDPSVIDDHAKTVGEVTSRSYSLKAIRGLLEHEDPKVRTLAAVAIFDREDPKLLPELRSLASDHAPTFDGHPKLRETYPPFSGRGPPQKEQTVGMIVSRMLNKYLQAAGYQYGIHAPEGQRGFDHYWKYRKNRSHCASWYAVKLSRACGGSSHVADDTRIARIREIRNEIDQLWRDDKTLIWEAISQETKLV
ncbi:MAG: hypothetical protein R3F19_34740 [Verrucomicrobiales bacterium]